MYSSEHFGRLFWVDDKLEFMTCPQFTDGTGDFDREEYVSDWTDLEGVNLDLLLDIYKQAKKSILYTDIFATYSLAFKRLK